MTKLLTPFYNPRTQARREHFALRGAEIIPLTPEGRVTVAILQLNEPDRVAKRRRLLDAGFVYVALVDQDSCIRHLGTREINTFMPISKNRPQNARRRCCRSFNTTSSPVTPKDWINNAVPALTTV